MGLNVFGYWKPNRVKEKGEVNKKVKSSGEVKKKVKSLGAHYKDTEKSVISIVKYLDETLETLDVKKNQLRKKALRPNDATKDGNAGCQESEEDESEKDPVNSLTLGNQR